MATETQRQQPDGGDDGVVGQAAGAEWEGSMTKAERKELEAIHDGIADRLDAIRARLRGASKGEWTNRDQRTGERLLRVFSTPNGFFDMTSRTNGNEVAAFRCGFNRHGNSEFIAHAKADIEWLLAQNEALERVAACAVNIMGTYGAQDWIAFKEAVEALQATGWEPKR